MSEERKDYEAGPGRGRSWEESRRRATRSMEPDRPCLNCGDPTPGAYCPSCGQRKVDVKVSVRTLIMDVLEDQFILDKRLPRTLGALFFQPGRLTIEHVSGRMVRYIHPFRLYLVSSLVFFLLLSFFSLRLVRRALEEESTGPDIVETRQAQALDESIAETRAVLADTTATGEEREAARALLARLTEQRQELRMDSLAASIASLDSALVALDTVIADTTVPASVRAALDANRDRLARRRSVADAQRVSLGGELGADTLAVAPEPDEAETLREMFGWDENPPTVNTPGPPAMDSALAGQIRRLGSMTPREAAEEITATFFDYVPIMMFVLLPVFAGVLKLLYIRRKRYYAEHFVFLLHVHSFVFFLATVMLLLRGLAAGWVESLLGLWLLVYIFLAMKRVYGQGWLKTFAKYWTLGWMYFWILLFSTGVAFVAALLLF